MRGSEEEERHRKLARRRPRYACCEYARIICACFVFAYVVQRASEDHDHPFLVKQFRMKDLGGARFFLSIIISSELGRSFEP